MSTDLDVQIRALFEGIERSQEPVSLEEIQNEAVPPIRPTAAPSRSPLARRLVWAAAFVLFGALAFFLAQRPGDRAVVATQPDLPTAEDGQDLNDGDDAPRLVVSPLVNIRAQLVNQSDVEVFTVESPVRDYWRVTSLDIFDGTIWRSRGSFQEATGPLDTDLPPRAKFTSVTQTFSINAWGGIWLPAAYEPAEVLANPSGVGVEYESQSGTLIVDRNRTSSDGLTYTLISAVPERDKAAIEAAADSVPDEIRTRYLQLPDDFSPRIVRLAGDVTAEASTQYEKALALQNFFRDPTAFTYDLDALAGHGSEGLEAFLFDVRVGYSEQFAGAYAVMARAVGLPARVAIGYTPGEFDASVGAYRVAGRHAHAWPEVWLEGIGWLRFEPTPGRGAPGDEIYTGLPEAQANDFSSR